MKETTNQGETKMENETIISVACQDGDVLLKMAETGAKVNKRLHQTMTISEALVFATSILDTCRQIQDTK